MKAENPTLLYIVIALLSLIVIVQSYVLIGLGNNIDVLGTNTQQHTFNYFSNS